MTEGLENLASKEYPGRVIIIGKDISGENTIVVYAITGRSPSSQARKMEQMNDGIWVRPTDEDMLKEGNKDLLIYPAILFSRGIAVSNGKQTTDIESWMSQSQNAAHILESSLSQWEYEPDTPNFTPRISGCVMPSANAAMSIIKRGSDGKSMRNIFNIPLYAGNGKMIATYSGENKDPLPSFVGEPLDVKLRNKTAESMAEMVYDSLKPKVQKKDYRVSVTCVFGKNMEQNQYDIFIINRH